MFKSDGKLGTMANFFIKHALAIFVAATVCCLILVASLTSYMKPPVFGAWLIVGIMTTLLLSGVALVVALAVAAFEKARRAGLVASPRQPRTQDKDAFIMERIKVEDFYLQPSLLNERKIFENCEILGPGSMCLHQSNVVQGCSFQQCDLVLAADPDQITAAACFMDSTFKGCRFVNMTIWLHRELAERLAAQSAEAGQALRIVGFEPKG